MMRRLVCAGLTVVLTVTASTAFASGAEQSNQGRSEAKTRFDRGERFFEVGDYPAALAEFEAAYRLVPRYEILFNIGVTQKKLFRWGESVRTFQKYLAEGGKKVSSERRREVDRELGDIRSLVAEVTVKVEGGEAEVFLDGQSAGKTPIKSNLLVSPGRHSVRATRPDFDPVEQTIEVISGVHLSITLAPKIHYQAPTIATLEIETLPTGASLSIDAKDVGKAPKRAVLEPGGHTLIADLKGYEKSRAEVFLTAGQTRPVRLELTALPEEVPWYRHWYVWTIVGVVAAGGAAGTFYATRAIPHDAIKYP